MRTASVKARIIGAVLLASTGLIGASPPTEARQQAAAKIDLKRLGPQVGERTPDFQLQDQAGKTWTLDTLLLSKGAMLVFYRSADW